MMERESFLLNEKIKFDEFNKNVEEEYKRKFCTVNRIDEYFDDNPSAQSSLSTSLSTSSSTLSSASSSSSSLLERKKKENTYLYKSISPFVNLVKHFYSSVRLIYEPKIYHLSIFLTGLWAYKNIKCINKLLFYKYNDIHYQITRPDSLNSRQRAFKVLVIGGLVLPCSFITFAIFDINKSKNNSMFIKNIEKSLSEQTCTSIIPYTLRRDISKKVRAFKEKTLLFAKDLAENNNFKKLSQEYHTNVEKRLCKYNLKKD
ncbi:conserved Plasmodium protein, unknown function [Plasmodium malariae]|uniref:Transmembrane protein n=1 Tax=Plasmodium malariae TaxID=5858 RepID=A0A1C3KDR9_PLAMA|nr:conserved Plasmodium protein, unknown function [Plasmodium malariae]